ncbi:MAG: hypothetical protein H7312_27975 [Tardiphaga sp.]|nr:hypothetical protein [Tardiphaga sp.]
MRELSAETRMYSQLRAQPRRSARRFATFCFYSAFALLVAIVFGTLSVRPF